SPSVNTTRVATTSAPTPVNISLRLSNVPPVDTTSSTIATFFPLRRLMSAPSSTSTSDLPVVMLITSLVTGSSMYGLTVLRATTYGRPLLTLSACVRGTALTSGVTRTSTSAGSLAISSSAAASVSSVSPSRFSSATETEPTLTTCSSRLTPPTVTTCSGTCSSP